MRDKSLVSYDPEIERTTCQNLRRSKQVDTSIMSDNKKYCTCCEDNRRDLTHDMR